MTKKKKVIINRKQQVILFKNNCIEYKSNGDRSRNLSLEKC